MATTSHLREINQRRVIQTMMRLQTASRAQLARDSKLSQPTVGRIVDDLLERSILAEVGAGEQSDVAVQDDPPQLGRPSKALQLDRSRRRFLAVQLGVSRTRVAALPMRVTDADEWEHDFPTPATADAFHKALHHHTTESGLRGLQGCVISLPGVVDERAGRVLLSPNLHWTEKADFSSILHSITPARLVYVQEIRALALGQLTVEPQVKDFLLVDFGSGVGAAAVIDAKLYDAPLPLSGELGHTPVVGNLRSCSCGAVGCVETLVSRGGLVATSVEHGGESNWEALVAQLQGGTLPRWMTDSLDAVATTIAGGLNLLGIRQVLVSGVLGEIPAAVEYLGAAIGRGAMWARFGEVGCRLIPRRRMVGMISLAINQIMLADSTK